MEIKVIIDTIHNTRIYIEYDFVRKTNITPFTNPLLMFIICRRKYVDVDLFILDKN